MTQPKNESSNASAFAALKSELIALAIATLQINLSFYVNFNVYNYVYIQLRCALAQ